MKFSKYDYKAAKDFLKDATITYQFMTPSYSHTIYKKPDGSLWSEVDSKLEYPEDDYRLEPKGDD